MKCELLLLTTFLLCGCDTLIVSGTTKVRIASNVRNFRVTAPGLIVDIGEVNNSTVIAAGFRGITKLMTAAIPLVTPGGVGVKAVTAIPAILPEFRNSPLTPP